MEWLPRSKNRTRVSNVHDDIDLGTPCVHANLQTVEYGILTEWVG